MPLLNEKYQIIVVLFSGFDESEDGEYEYMEKETIFIEEYIKNNYSNRVHAIYACSLEESFARYFVASNNIKIDRIILGSSDLDHRNKLLASIKEK